VGKRGKVKIIKFDDQREQVELSRKGLMPHPYPGYQAAHRVGQVVPGVIRNTNRSFAYVDLGNGVEGIIHVSKLAPHRISEPADVVSAGQRIQAKIVDFDDNRTQVVLALSW
jgi:ribosomal protein S1